MMHLYIKFIKSTKHNKNNNRWERRNSSWLTLHLLARLTELKQYFTLYMVPGQAGVTVSMVRRELEADNYFLAFPKYNSLKPKLHYRLAKCEEQHWFVL